MGSGECFWFLVKTVFQDQGGAFKVKTLSQIMIFEVRLRLFIFDDQGKLFKTKVVL